MNNSDNYEVPAIVETVEDKLAAFRGLAKEEVKKTKMTERAAAALRAIGEHDRSNKAADAVLVKWFNDQTKTVDFMMDVMYRIRKNDTADIRKRAVKCFYMLQRGLKVYTIYDVMFLGELLPEETTMSITQILNRYPIDEDKAIASVEPEAPEVRLCVAGKKCLRYEHRHPAPVKGAGHYCSTACAASVRARVKRALTAVPTANRLN